MITLEVPGPFKVEAHPYTMELAKQPPARSRFWLVLIIVLLAGLMAAALARRKKTQ